MKQRVAGPMPPLKTVKSKISAAPLAVEVEEPVAPRNLVQVIGRAASILRALEGEPNGLSLGQIAQRVHLARSTVQRIAGALEEEKLLIAASPNGRMRLGPSLLRLANSVQIDMAAIASPLIKKLSAELGETVDLAYIRKDHLVFMDQSVGPQRQRVVSAIGETFPLYCTANGKAALAMMPDATIEKLVGHTYPRRTPHTLVTLQDLLRDVDAVRRSGIAFDREEHTVGICAAGIALQDPVGNVGAISVPVPLHRFKECEATITEALLRLKGDLGSLLAN